MNSLEGRCALVTGGDQSLGRALGLALAARGVCIVVTGRDEKALGETVGEIAHGGGKARHLVGDALDPAHLAAAVNRSIDVFGGLDFVLANPIDHVPRRRKAEHVRTKDELVGDLISVYYTFNAA